MKTFVFLVVFLVFLTGCAILDKIAPPKYDSEGNAIPGSREATTLTKLVSENVPYGGVALNLLLFVVAGYERYRSVKLGNGLKATLLAGKKVAADPAMKDLWDKVKEEYYRPVHAEAGVTKLIKSLLAKLPSIKSA